MEMISRSVKRKLSLLKKDVENQYFRSFQTGKSIRKSDGKSLGLELLSRHLLPGEIPSHYLMAIWMNAADEPITRQRLQQIEKRALRKMRIRLCEHGNRELLEHALYGVKK